MFTGRILTVSGIIEINNYKEFSLAFICYTKTLLYNRWPLQDSNLYRWFRRPMLYQLN